MQKNPGWSPSVITILDTPGSFGVRVLLASCPNHSEERIFPPERQYLATLLASRTAPQHSLPCSQTNNLAPQTQDRTFWSHEGKGLLFPCAHDWNWTSDLSLFRRMLFQLSYEGFYLKCITLPYSLKKVGKQKKNYLVAFLRIRRLSFLRNLISSLRLAFLRLWVGQSAMVIHLLCINQM